MKAKPSPYNSWCLHAEIAFLHEVARLRREGKSHMTKPSDLTLPEFLGRYRQSLAYRVIGWQPGTLLGDRDRELLRQATVDAFVEEGK